MDAGSIAGVRIEPQAPSRQAFITPPGQRVRWRFLDSDHRSTRLPCLQFLSHFASSTMSRIVMYAGSLTCR